MKKHTFLLALLLLLSMAAKAQEIVVSTNSLTGFSYIVNHGPSNEDSFDVSATGLLNDTVPESIIITASENFEISTVSGEDFQGTVVLAADAIGIVDSTTIYVRMVDSLSEGPYHGYIRLWSIHAQEVLVYCQGQVNRPTLPAPEFSLGGGTYSGEQMVAITCDIESSSIRYRFDAGSEWMNYTQSILVNRDLTIWAKATKEGYYDSEEASAEYSIEYVVEVTCDPERGAVSGSDTYHYDDIATLTATPNEGYEFSSWNNGETANPMEITVTGNATYHANFEAISYQITVVADPENGGVVSGGGNYHFPDTPMVTAVANENYAFVNWTENDEVISEEPEYTIMGWSSHNLVAHFKLTALPVIVDDIISPEPICAGNSLQLTAPEVSLADTAGWQMSADSTFAVFSVYTDQILDETYDGWRLRYMASNEAGTTYSEQVAIAVYPVVEEDAVVSIVGKKCGDKIEHILVYPREGYHYQWYLDDEALADTAQYIYCENGLKSGTYRVEISLSRNSDGELQCPVSSPEYEVRWLGKSVYPNPSHPQATIFVENDGEEGAVLTVVAVEGRTVFRQLLKTGQNTLCTSLPKGIYLFSIADSQSIRTEKVIIQ